MGQLRRTRETERLTFGEDWLEVRVRPTGGDRMAVQQAAFGRANANARGAEIGLDIDVTAPTVVAMTRAIAAWSFVDESGAPAPITAANVVELDADIWDAVVARVNELWAERRDPNAVGSGPNGRTPSTAAELSLAASNGSS